MVTARRHRKDPRDLLCGKTGAAASLCVPDILGHPLHTAHCSSSPHQRQSILVWGMGLSWRHSCFRKDLGSRTGLNPSHSPVPYSLSPSYPAPDRSQLQLHHTKALHHFLQWATLVTSSSSKMTVFSSSPMQQRHQQHHDELP